MKDQKFSDEWNKKGFIHSMQAKGKIPRFVTEAQERQEKVTSDTQRRIFPAVFGRDYAEEQMLQMAAKRISENATMLAERSLKNPPAAGSSSEPATAPQPAAGVSKSSCSVPHAATASSGGGEKPPKDRTQRRLLQARLRTLESELITEREARIKLEDSLAELNL